VLTILAASVIMTIYANLAEGGRSGPETGDKAPDFILTDQNGQRHRLSEYKGQGVLVNFWATYCEPCKEEMSLLEEQYRKYKNEGVHILAVNIGETDVVLNRFLERHELSFPVLNDRNQEVVDAFGVNPLPATFLIDKEGTITGIHEGPILNEKMAAEMMEKIKP
ncbi:MAG: thiol-disulfide oxidoreductase ResA, partial [Bacillales bacterium]